jgi:hypothetical protein
MTLLADSLELWSPSTGYAFELRVGRPGKDLPIYRGENVTLPTKPGQTFMSKVADNFPVRLYGIVMGAGTGQSAAESYMTRMDALNDILDVSNGQFTLTLNSGAEGLAEGEQATITVEFLRWTISAEGLHYRIGDIECQCISDPPGWTVVAGS